jgi:hypothetical protein
MTEHTFTPIASVIHKTGEDPRTAVGSLAVSLTDGGTFVRIAQVGTTGSIVLTPNEIPSLAEAVKLLQRQGPIASDEELCELYDNTRDTRPNSLRAIYNLGRQHAAAAQSTSLNPQ